MSEDQSKMDPDFVDVATYGQGFNIGATVGGQYNLTDKISVTLNAGYTHNGYYNTEGTFVPATGELPTLFMRPGQTLSTSAAVGYASTPFSLSLTGSYSHQTVTYVNQAPSFQAGDSITLSTLASLTVADWSAFNFTASYTNTAKNEALDPTSSLFFIQNDNANSNLFKAELGQTSTVGKWQFGPYGGYVDRRQNTFDPLNYSFVPAKTILYAGGKLKYQAKDNLTFSFDVQRFTSKIQESPDKSSDGIFVIGSGYPALYFSGWKSVLELNYQF
jgi:hypothetical protein